jgi:glycosyltransferase involved in cell wall biosynthesis
MIKSTYLTITPFFPTEADFRGPFIFDQVEAIIKTEMYDVVVLKPKPWYSFEKDYEFEGIKVFRFKTYQLPSNLLPGLFDFLSCRSLSRKINAIGIKTTDIKIVHAHVTALGVFAISLKKKNPTIKTILQHHGFDVLSIENGILRKLKWHRSWVRNYGIKICNAIDLHVGVSQKTLDYLKTYDEITIKESYVLYNGINPAKFYKIPNSKNQNFFTIGCIGSFWDLKDQITLLKATQILVEENRSPIRVKLIGTGTTLQTCKQYVIENKLQDYVEFIDSLPHDQLVYFYNSLDLFVLPSYHEAFGCVYAEAHACGVPFIAVEGQGIGELILTKNQSNQTIKKKDSVYLASLMKFYAVNNDFFPTLSIDYKIENLINQLINKLNNTSIK